jgi:hypothetical protein
MKSHHLFKFLFFDVRFDPFLFEVGSQECVQAHVNVSYPYQCKTGDNIADPICHQKFKICKEEKKYSDVVTEAKFAGKSIEEFADNNAPFPFTSTHTILVSLPKNLFVRNCPRDARDRERQYQQPE